ncbi:hypothetical protein G1C95_1917 [Bifidobacterium sp. DSM 109957]|uniref:Uncharacterized protein n=1 Tax=Bifidobacterium oedipodis TaxID=2675322 RepID=A0A7Y0HUG4_9BIFI|nr:hypothetical protein [Bifidobacterium sp. DSM 109957]
MDKYDEVLSFQACEPDELGEINGGDLASFLLNLIFNKR